jgi:hypothetical protein
MPPLTATSRQRQASAANFIGGTTKQFDWLTKGRSAAPRPRRNRVQHLQRSGEVLGLRSCFTCLVVLETGVGVEIHFEGIGYIARHHGTLGMNMLHHVDHARYRTGPGSWIQ